MKRTSYVLLSLQALLCINQLSADFSDDTIDTQKFLDIWYHHPDDYNKRGIRYYDFIFNGAYFEGNRHWEDRWQLINKATSFSGKRILDLGSHIGLCSLFISKYLPIESLVSVEKLEKCISKHKRLQDLFNVNYNIIELDLNTENYEKILGYDYDIVICMSFLKWVTDKNRLLWYLSNFSQVIFEGHDHESIEIERFRKVGFKYHKLLGKTKETKKSAVATRPVLLFSKEKI
jgi:2-polyprenyl-3-methyl-5-hydroxy-6-metoxy-1,4-benzoquinol methylase